MTFIAEVLLTYLALIWSNGNGPLATVKSKEGPQARRNEGTGKNGKKKKRGRGGDFGSEASTREVSERT
jgi:hypothetical protein